MPPITALLHTMNDALRLGRTLEMLLPCAEILIVDHHSADATRRIAREYGARIVTADNDAPANHYLDFVAMTGFSVWSQENPSPKACRRVCSNGVRCLATGWELLGGSAFSVSVREQTDETWLELPAPETRLIPRSWIRWQGRLPAHEPSAIALQGAILRFTLP